MRRRGVALGGLLLCWLAAAEAIWPFNTDSKKDNHIDRLETPVRFNCAAKYVDFNGGWVVDVTSFVREPLWLSTDDLVPGLGGHTGTMSGVKPSGEYRIDLCRDVQYFVCPDPPCRSGASLEDQTSFGMYKYSNFTEAQILDIPVSSGGTPSLSQFYEKGHSKRVCQDIPADPWEMGLREAQIVVQCGTSNCPSGTAPVCGKLACLCGPIKVETKCGGWSGVEHSSYQKVVLTAIIPTCQPQPSKKIGLNMGRSPGGRELAVDGLAMSQAKLPIVSANETSTTFYLTMQDPLDLKDHGVFLQAPIIKYTDYLGNLAPVITQGKDGGLVGRNQTLKEAVSFPITVVYNCKGAESVATMTLEIRLDPYDPMFFSWQKMCPFSTRPPEMPMDLIATHYQGSVQFSWAAPSSDNGSPVSFYILEAISPNRPTIRVQLSTDYRSTGPRVQSVNPVTYVWHGLPGGASYTFRVAAQNHAGISLYSPQSMPITLAKAGEPSSYSGPAQWHPPTPAPAARSLAGAEWSGAGLFFFWTTLFGMLFCVATCLYRSHQGETGFELVPGHSFLYELDDMYCGARLTSSCRVWSPLAAGDRDDDDDLPGITALPPQASLAISSEAFGRNESAGDIPLKETTTFSAAGQGAPPNSYSSAGPPPLASGVNPFAGSPAGSPYNIPVEEDWSARDPPPANPADSL